MLWLLGGQWQELFAMVDTLERNIDVEDIAMALVRLKMVHWRTLSTVHFHPSGILLAV